MVNLTSSNAALRFYRASRGCCKQTSDSPPPPNRKQTLAMSPWLFCQHIDLRGSSAQCPSSHKQSCNLRRGRGERGPCEGSGLARSETGSALQRIGQKGRAAYICLPPTLNDRPGPLVITTSPAETLTGFFRWGADVNKQTPFLQVLTDMTCFFNHTTDGMYSRKI